MSALEFPAPTGETFTASGQLYNASTGATVGAALTPVEGPTGMYRVSTPSTGVLYFAAESDNGLLVVGYVNLDEPAANGYSELCSTYEQAANVGKIGLIGTVSATLSAPVNETGTISANIVIGDDYLIGNGRAFQWVVDEPIGFAAATSTCWFGAKKDANNLFLVQGTIIDNGSTLTLSFDLTKSTTVNLEPGEYAWNVAVHDADGVEITAVRSDRRQVKFVSKYT